MEDSLQVASCWLLVEGQVQKHKARTVMARALRRLTVEFDLRRPTRTGLGAELHETPIYKSAWSWTL
jgi:hypothetical protein